MRVADVTRGIDEALREIADSVSPRLYGQVNKQTALSERENNAACFMKERVNKARKELDTAERFIRSRNINNYPPRLRLVFSKRLDRKKENLRKLLEESDLFIRRQTRRKFMDEIDAIEMYTGLITNGYKRKDILKQLDDLKQSVERLYPLKHNLSSELIRYREIADGLRNTGSRAITSIINYALRTAREEFYSFPLADSFPWIEVVSPYDLPPAINGDSGNGKVPLLVNSEHEDRGVLVGQEFPLSLFLHRHYNKREAVTTKLEFDLRHLKLLNNKSTELAFRFPENAEYLVCNFQVRADSPCSEAEWIDATGEKDLVYLVDNGRYLPGEISVRVEISSLKNSQNYLVSMPIPILENCVSSV